MSNALTMHKICIHTLDWQTFLTEIRRYGFRCGYTDIFEGDGINSKKSNEEEVILFNEEKGLIIYAYTFCGKRMGRATIYGQIPQKFQSMTEKQKRFFTNYAICMKSSKDGIAFEMRVSKDFESFMRRLFDCFDFLPQWKDGIIPNFLNYVESRASHDEHRSTTETKLNSCFQEVRRIIAQG